MLSSLNAAISTNESAQFITGYLIYNPAYTYKFQLKTIIDEESENTRTFLKRVRSTKMANKNLARIAMQNETTKKHMTAESRPSLVSLAGGQTTSSNKFGLESGGQRPSLSAQGSMMGFHFAHKFVSRMASNTSQLSGISGFSDDQDVDDFEQGNLLRGIGNKPIRR